MAINKITRKITNEVSCFKFLPSQKFIGRKMQINPEDLGSFDGLINPLNVFKGGQQNHYPRPRFQESREGKSGCNQMKDKILLLFNLRITRKWKTCT